MEGATGKSKSLFFWNFFDTKCTKVAVASVFIAFLTQKFWQLKAKTTKDFHMYAVIID